MVWLQLQIPSQLAIAASDAGSTHGTALWRHHSLLHPPSPMQGVHLQGRCCAQQPAPQAGCAGCPGPASHSAGGPPGLPHFEGPLMRCPGMALAGVAWDGRGGARAGMGRCHHGSLTACHGRSADCAGQLRCQPSMPPRGMVPDSCHAYHTPTLTLLQPHCPLRPAIPACRCPGAA